MAYEHLMDFIGDMRTPEKLHVPPGGSTGDSAADALLCESAERAKCHAYPIFLIRERAAHFAALPEITPTMMTVLKRMAEWSEEGFADAFYD